MSALSSIHDCSRSSDSVYTIGDGNQFVGDEVDVTWLRPWGKKPAGFHIRGTLNKTFSVHGRTLIGEVFGKSDADDLTLGDRTYSCPWSRKFIRVDVTGNFQLTPTGDLK